MFQVRNGLGFGATFFNICTVAYDFVSRFRGRRITVHGCGAFPFAYLSVRMVSSEA